MIYSEIWKPLMFDLEQRGAMYSFTNSPNGTTPKNGFQFTYFLEIHWILFRTDNFHLYTKSAKKYEWEGYQTE